MAEVQNLTIFSDEQYNRIYSPVSFGKKYDPNGNYIRHFLPVLKGMLKFDPFHILLFWLNVFHCLYD